MVKKKNLTEQLQKVYKETSIINVFEIAIRNFYWCISFNKSMDLKAMEAD